MGTYRLVDYSWSEFFLLALALLVLSAVLYILGEFIRRSHSTGYVQTQLRKWSTPFFVLYELGVLTILATAFVLINPYVHGLVLLVLILGSWRYLRSYISGRWVLFDRDIRDGFEIKVGDLQGVVLHTKRLKMELQTQTGLHHISYTDLLDKGYTLVSGDRIGGYYHLSLSPSEAVENVSNHRSHLLDLFVMTPYVDWHHKIELFQDDDNVDTVETRVLIREESHLHELVALIKEWGYHCRMLDT